MALEIIERPIVVCDICNKVIPYQSDNAQECMVCGRDICSNCKVTLTRNNDVTIGTLCKVCTITKKIIKFNEWDINE